MDVVLDTNALSAFAECDPDLSEHLAGFGELNLPVIVLGEYRYGISRSKFRKTYETWLNELIPMMTVLPVMESTSIHMHSSASNSGRPELPFHPMMYGLPHSVLNTNCHCLLATNILKKITGLNCLQW